MTLEKFPFWHKVKMADSLIWECRASERRCVLMMIWEDSLKIIPVGRLGGQKQKRDKDVMV